MEREDVINEIQRLFDQANAQFDVLEPLLVKISRDFPRAHNYLLEVTEKSLSYKRFLVDYMNTLVKIENIARVQPIVPDVLLHQVRDLLKYLLNAEKYIDGLRNFIAHGLHIPVDEESHSHSGKASEDSPAAQSKDAARKIDWNLVLAFFALVANLLMFMQTEAQNDKQHEELIQKLDEIRITIERQADVAVEADEDNKK